MRSGGWSRSSGCRSSCACRQGFGFFPIDAHVRIRPGRQAAQVLRADSGKANDVRSNHNQDVVLLQFFRVLREMVVEYREFSCPGNSSDVVGLDPLDEPAKHAHFALFQTNVMLDFSLADYGLIDAADIARA